MSMYNMLFGVNKGAPLLLAVLGTTIDKIPRFRDAYLTDDGKIAIYTRTGGGNRDGYENKARRGQMYDDVGPDSYEGPWNDDLRALPGFVSDEDDGYDSTYATFYFEIPELTKKSLVLLGVAPPELVPGKNADALIQKLNDPSKKDDPEVLKALEAIRPIMEKISSFLGDEVPGA